MSTNRKAFARDPESASAEELKRTLDLYEVTPEIISRLLYLFKRDRGWDGCTEEIVLSRILAARHDEGVCHLFDDYPCPSESPENRHALGMHRMWADRSCPVEGCAID